MSWSLWKIPLIITNATGIHIAYTPPNPIPNADELHQYGSRNSDLTLLFKLRRHAAIVAKGIHWAFASCESLVILAYAFPSTHSQPILTTLLHRAENASAVRVTPQNVVGCALVVAGVGIRLACQRELGRFFTWEKSVKKDQQLVTSGPYAVVRHPSYTGMLLATVGTLLCHLGPGNWLLQSSLLESPWTKGLVVLWIAYSAGLPCVMFFRTFDEDRVLRAHFPEQWDAYAKRVPYRLVPYIF
ncbi:hypothetical protein BDY19DRAFT_995362 [Irpex rosettiformis]|uniref:Uncharacterized protein n=1 Tax=Irpex rosettiformis TaxID=378272 RepID=A0ACB8TXW3_9APHY|nr:hypothetical protein BDY19DRAFT_995362 [Irpex rosettiformis]